MPDLTGLLSAAETAAEVAARHAATADTERRLPGEVVEALLTAGFARRFVPGRFGGEAVGFTELMESVAEVAEGCASAGWVASLMAQGSRISGYLPARGQDEVWGKGPDTLAVVGFVSQGAARPVDGGWVLSGSWPYVSGIEFSDWALVLADGGDARFFAVPRTEYGVTESWFTLGMRATGSHTLTLDEVFVPAHRSFPRDEMFLGRPAVSREPFHTVPLFAVNGLTFGSPVLGAARRVLRLAAAELPARDSARIGYARAAAEVGAAELLLARVAERADRGSGHSEESLRRTSLDSALAVRLLVEAADRVFADVGTRGQAETQPLQRGWRDVHAAATHGALRFEPAALRFTEPLLGNP